MTYQNFVELGRVAYVHFGALRGQVVVILDILNENRVLIENPTSGVERQIIPVKRLSLTKFRVPIVRAPKTATLRAAIEKFDLKGKWEKSTTAQRIALKARRAKLTDFERFRAMVLKRRISHSVKKTVGAALRGGKKAPATKKTVKK